MVGPSGQTVELSVRADCAEGAQPLHLLIPPTFPPLPPSTHIQADCLPDAEEVFSFLETHGVCQRLALFHIARASCLELKGAHAKADEAYERGIALRAVPLDRLRAKHVAFQHRMARRIERDGASGGGAPGRWGQAATAAEPAARRFGTALAASGPRVGAAPALGLAPRPRALAAQAGPPSGVLSVLADDDRENGAPGRLPVPAAGSGWGRFAPAAAAVKENTQRAMPWTEQRLPQPAAAPVPALEIFADEEMMRPSVRVVGSLDGFAE